MSLQRMVLDLPQFTQTDIERALRIQSNKALLSIRSLSDFLRGIAGGARRAVVEICTGAVQSAASLTLTGAPTATETFVLCGRTFTARASGAVVNEFNIGGDVTTTAANIAAAINASDDPRVTGSVVATSLAGVVTITAKVPGTLGNGLVLTESLSNATRVDFAGGTEGTSTTFNLS